MSILASDQQALDDSSDSDISLFREKIRPQQLDPSAAAAQAVDETTTSTSPLFLTADRLVTTVQDQDTMDENGTTMCAFVWMDQPRL